MRLVRLQPCLDSDVEDPTRSCGPAPPRRARQVLHPPHEVRERRLEFEAGVREFEEQASLMTTDDRVLVQHEHLVTERPGVAACGQACRR